ncbi:hypothetical protein ACW2QC_07315 [Virgibacillus sp. FSP13]
MLLIVGLILGAVIGYKINGFVKRMDRNGIKFKMFGLNIAINKTEEESLMIDTSKAKKPVKLHIRS